MLLWRNRVNSYEWEGESVQEVREKGESERAIEHVRTRARQKTRERERYTHDKANIHLSTNQHTHTHTNQVNLYVRDAHTEQMLLLYKREREK